MKFNNLLYSVVLVIFVFIFGCKSGTNQTDDDVNVQDESLLDKEHVKKVKMIFYNIPSPMEMANLLQNAGADYNPDILNDYRSYYKYTTNAKLALNLGIYGADLSYTRMFDQIQSSVNYLTSIRKMSDGLGIPEEEGSFTINKIEENIENKDSILSIISVTYSNADSYLKENGRGSTAAMILLGGWLEALYIATNIIDEKNQNPDIINRIAEQKFSLSNLIELIVSYESDQDIQKYVPQLKQLQAKFEQIEITYTKGEIITDEEKMITIIDSQMTIDVSFDVIIDIGNIVEEIRSEIIE
ncbi:MAG: hypothetical protein ABIJ97_14195 [Bacteroidota bacterium]